VAPPQPPDSEPIASAVVPTTPRERAELPTMPDLDAGRDLPREAFPESALVPAETPRTSKAVMLVLVAIVVLAFGLLGFYFGRQ